MQYPEDTSVLLNSTVWMLCVFDYPPEENEEPVVYWRKGPDRRNQQSLQSSPDMGRSQVHIMKNTLRGFSILKLSNVDQNASNSYFCDVTLTQKIQGKRGNGTKLTVHGKEHLGVTETDLMCATWIKCSVSLTAFSPTTNLCCKKGGKRQSTVVWVEEGRRAFCWNYCTAGQTDSSGTETFLWI